jgi:hypothetical protein
VAVDVGDGGAITKRLELDPTRQPMIELMFRLALRRRSTVAIARALNDAGWRTNPNRRGSSPRSWTYQAVRGVLGNPRYAGIATIKGEVLGKGRWPPYVTEREHRRIAAWLKGVAPVNQHQPREAYLFAGLARCGHCGSSMQVHTRRKRIDGTPTRRYTCTSHERDCTADACPARPIDADMVEAMFVDALPVLFGEPGESDGGLVDPRVLGVKGSDERRDVLEAARAGDDGAFDRAFARLLAQISSENALPQRLAARSRRARRLEVIAEFQAWATIWCAVPTDELRQETRRLSELLHTWLSAVAIAMDPRSISIIVHHRSSEGELHHQDSVSFRRSEWRRYSQVAQRTSQPHFPWHRPEIIAALQQWAGAHGHAPRASDWEVASFEHPNARTVRRHFTSWRRALRAAKLSPANPSAVRVWTDDAIIRALQISGRHHGRAPRSHEWICGTSLRPCATTVYNHFGSWSAALGAAHMATQNGGVGGIDS